MKSATVLFDTQVYLPYGSIIASRDLEPGWRSIVVWQERMVGASGSKHLKRLEAEYKQSEKEGRLLIPDREAWLMAGRILHRYLSDLSRKSPARLRPELGHAEKQNIIRDVLIAVSAKKAGVTVVFDWSRGRPAPEVNEDGFSVRWTGKFVPPETGQYELGAMADDGVRVYLDGQLLVDAWANDQLSRISTTMKAVQLEGGRAYDVRLEYYENVRNAIAKFFWSFPGFSEKIKAEAVNAARQADAVVAVLGISPALEGEEMSVNVAGFRGGDRTDITLPQAQEDLLKALQATGKPVIVVLLNGSALAVNYAAEKAAALVEAWYPGEAGGTALADVLFGAYNPGGRLPVTFYQSVEQLPPFEDYRMQGRTYRYFKGAPLYPFGFGLSYTRFKYDNLKLSAKSVKAGDGVRISADVQNIGERAGDEVVQLYVTDVAASVPVPIRSLAGVKRLALKPGEKQTVSFTLTREQMTLIDDHGKRIIEPGEFLVSVGGKQPGFTGRADAQTTSTVSGKFVVTGKALAVP